MYKYIQTTNYTKQKKCTIHLLLVVSMARVFSQKKRSGNILNVLNKKGKNWELVQRIARNTDKQNITKTDRNLKKNT